MAAHFSIGILAHFSISIYIYRNAAFGKMIVISAKKNQKSIFQIVQNDIACMTEGDRSGYEMK